MVLSTMTARAARAGTAPASVQTAIIKAMVIGCILLISSLLGLRALVDTSYAKAIMVAVQSASLLQFKNTT